MIREWIKTAGDKVSKMAPDIRVPELPVLRDRSVRGDLQRSQSAYEGPASCSKDHRNGGLTYAGAPPETASRGTCSKTTRAESFDSMDKMATGSSSKGGGFGFFKDATNKLFSKLSLDHDEENCECTDEAGAAADSPKKTPSKASGKSPKKEKGKKADEEKKDKFHDNRRCSKIEKSKYASMWRNIVNNSMVGTGVVTKAAIVSQDGQILAQSEEMSLKKDQILLLNRAIHSNPGELAVNGIVLGDDHFRYTRSEIGNAVYGVDETGDGGCAVCATKRCLMVGIYERGPHEANNLVEELSEYLRGRDM